MALARNLFSALILSTVLCGVGGSSLGLAMVKQEAAHLPPLDPLVNYHPSVTSHMFAADGSTMGEFAVQDREFVPFSELPPLLVQAFVSAEDRNYWRHDGVDPYAIARAALFDLRGHKSHHKAIGASTITQQVIKNLIVGDAPTLHRKAQEALLAIEADKRIGKKRLMEIYLNEIYLGDGAYGVASAAKVYFGKSLSELNVADMAFLAILPKGPSNYDPVRHPVLASERRDYVIGRMLEDGAISTEQAASARQQPLPAPRTRNISGAGTDFFSEAVRREVVARWGTDALYHQGVSVHTTMDPRLQVIADNALRKGLVEYDERHGWRGPLGNIAGQMNGASEHSWAVALNGVDLPAGSGNWRLGVVLAAGKDAIVGLQDGSSATLPLDGMRWARPVRGEGLGPTPARADGLLTYGDVILVEVAEDRTLLLRQIPEVQGSLVAMDLQGHVRALVGGFSYEQGSYDRATQSMRQPGSTFKPFIFLTAFEQGYDPSSPVLDSPISLDVGQGSERWRPGADGGQGWGMITASRALEHSRNLASVRLLNDIGLDAVADTTRKFGLYDTLPNFAAALGALETTDLKLTAAYAMIANGGYRISPTLIETVIHSDTGAVDREAPFREDESTRVADPDAVRNLTTVLHGVVKEGTAARYLSSINLPLAGKTGTSNENKDAWFVGYSPDLVVGVHVGFDRPKGLGSDEFGAKASAPIFGDFIQKATLIYPVSAKDFPPPTSQSPQE